MKVMRSAPFSPARDDPIFEPLLNDPKDNQRCFKERSQSQCMASSLLEPEGEKPGVSRTNSHESARDGVFATSSCFAGMQRVPMGCAAVSIAVPLNTRSMQVMEPVTSGKSILVVDDEETIRNMLMELLRTEGHKVQPACGRMEVLDALERTKFDLVVTDVIMPEFDGMEVIRVVKELQPDAALIAMSGGGEYMSRELCRKITKQFHTVSFIGKPIGVDDFLLLVDRTLEGSEKPPH
jgi:CheY-like chemotaxis protein